MEPPSPSSGRAAPDSDPRGEDHPLRAAPKRRARARAVSMTDPEWKTIQAAATRAGMTASALIRLAVERLDLTGCANCEGIPRYKMEDIRREMERFDAYRAKRRLGRGASNA